MTITPNYDLLYSTEYEAKSKNHFEVLRDDISSNSERSNAYLKNQIQDSLKQELLTMKGRRDGNVEHYDQYFEWLCSDIGKARRNYAVNPISKFVKNEYPALRKEGKAIKHIKPEIYKLNEADTVKYIAGFEALSKLYDTIAQSYWLEGESSEFILKKLQNKSETVTASDIENIGNNHKEPEKIDLIEEEVKKVIYSPTSYAVTYFLLSRANHPGFPWHDEKLKLYCEAVNNELKMIAEKEIKYQSFRRIVYKLHSDINLVKLNYLEASKLKLVKYDCKLAILDINKYISKIYRDKVR